MRLRRILRTVRRSPELKVGLHAVPLGLLMYFYWGERFGLLLAGFGVFLVPYWWLWERKRSNAREHRPTLRRWKVTLLVLVALVAWFFVGHYFLTPEDSWSEELKDFLLIAAIIVAVDGLTALYRRSNAGKSLLKDEAVSNSATMRAEVEQHLIDRGAR